MRYRDADFSQKGAFNRAVYGFALLIVAALLASSSSEMRWLIKPALAIWQFTLLSSLPTLLGFYPSGGTQTGKTPNTGFVGAFWCLTVSFFTGRPGFSAGYRFFRAFLGVFLTGMALVMTVALGPILLVELAWACIAIRFLRTNLS